MNSATLVLLLPLLFFRPPAKAPLKSIALTGLLTGSAFALYGSAIMMTDVLRALLFFYLTPIWGTALGVLFLGEKLTLARIAAIVLALLGLVCVAGFGSRSELNLGDILSFISGILWAIGTFRMYKMVQISAIDQSISFLLGSVVVMVFLLLVLGDTMGEFPAQIDFSALYPIVIFTGLFSIPMVFLTLWPTSFLAPGRVGVLLMGEIVVGVSSAAIWAGEPFGLFEAIGTALIVSASLVEVLGNRS